MPASPYTDQDFLQKMVNMGFMAYDTDRIIAVLDIPPGEEAAFRKELDNKESLASKSYKQGEYKREYFIDTTLYNKSKAGDINSLHELEGRISARLASRVGKEGDNDGIIAGY